MRLSALGGGGHGAFEQGAAALEHVRQVQERAAQLERAAERDERVHVVGLEVERLLEERDRPLHRFGAWRCADSSMAREYGFEGLGRVRLVAEGAAFALLEFALQALPHQIFDQAILQLEHVVHRAVDLGRRHGAAFLHGDRLRP